jgi:hypothetical protein
VQALIDWLAADGLSVSRIRSVLSAVRALYGYAIDQGHVDSQSHRRRRDPATAWRRLFRVLLR